MTRQVFFPDPDRKPSGFSPAARIKNAVFVSGQVPVDSSGNLVGEGDCRIQAEQCFVNIESALRSAGASMDDVTKITAFIVRSDDYPDYARVRLSKFPENGPASSSVFISGLVDPKFLIEIEAIAIVEG